MAALRMHLTDAGMAALQGPGGSSRVTISQVGLTDTPFDPAPTLTALPGEFKRLDVLSGIAAAPNVTHLTAYDRSEEAWTITGFGLFSDAGVLFAYYTGTESLMSKAALAFAMFVSDITFAADLAAQIDYGDAAFAWPPATEQMRGIARLATQHRVDAAEDGEDDAETIVTPKTLRARLAALWSAIVTAIGAEALARSEADDALHEDIQTRLRADSYTAADVLEKVKSVDGPASGLNADLLDGLDSSDFAKYLDYQFSLGTTGGYERLPNGRILQWGWNEAFTNRANNTVTFPVTFPNGVIAMWAAMGTDVTLTENRLGFGAGPISNSQGRVAVAATAAGTIGAYWFALGH